MHLQFHYASFTDSLQLTLFAGLLKVLVEKMATAKYWQSNKPPSALLSLGCLFFFCGLLFCVSCNTTTANEWVHSEEGRSKRCVECADNGRFLNRSSLSNEQVDLSNPVANLSDAKTPIDWDEVEANFNRVLSEDEVFHKWDTMEANMKSGLIDFSSLQAYSMHV